jgi:regulator of protease activity HflC (stomatin/prohibitin superfamily)
MFGFIAVIVVLLVVLIFLAQTVKIVPKSRVGIIPRFGRYQRTAESGLTFVVPIMDQMLPKTDLREQVVSH